MGYIPTRMCSTNSMAGFRRELKKVVKSLVVSAKRITVDELDIDFIHVEGRSIPYFALSCSTLKAYVESLDDIFSVDPSTGVISLLNLDVPELNKSSHIRKFVENGEDDDRGLFVCPDILPNQLPRWNIMDIISQIPYVEFESQLNIVVYLNRNKGGVTVEEFKTAMISVLEIRSIDRVYGSFERLLDKLQHLIRISGGRIYPDLDIYSPEIRDVGLDRYYYVPKIPIIPDSVKRRVEEILKGESHGMWSQFLPEKYEERFGFPLDFWTFGFPTVQQFLATIPEVVLMRRFEFQFRIYATKNPYPPEPGVPTGTVKNILKMLARFVEGVDIHYFQTMYKMLFNEPLIIEPLGFNSLMEALESLTSDGIVIQKVDEETMVKLRSCAMVRSIVIVRPFMQTNIDALPFDLYPSWVLRPQEKVPRVVFFDEVLKPGTLVDLEVQAIYGPAAFFVNFKNGYCQEMQYELNAFYEEHNECLEMPANACVEGLFCVSKAGNNYQRVVILSKGLLPSSVNVLMIDYGHIQTVHLNLEFLYFLHRTFANVPNQAVFCYIPNIEPTNFLTEFTDECKQLFTYLVMNKTLQAKIYKMNHRNLEMAVFLYDSSSGESVDIRRVLVDNYFANVTFKKPRCDKELYAAWSLYTRLP